MLHNVSTYSCKAVEESYSCEVQDLHSADETETNEQSQQTSSAGCKTDSKQLGRSTRTLTEIHYL